MPDVNFTAISAMVLILMAFSTRKSPSEAARRGRIVLLVVLAIFIGVSYYLSTYVSAQASTAWSIGFWIIMAAWGVSLRDRGLILIGLFFAILYAVVGFGLPLLLRR
jgi:hypothetical protein